MVIQCVVFKCSNRQGSKAKEKGVSFFRFPKDRRKRAAWIKTINRNNWAPNEYSRVCSEHFVDSWHSDDPTDINYRPTLFSYKTREPSETQAAREERHSKRNLLQVIWMFTLRWLYTGRTYIFNYCRIDVEMNEFIRINEFCPKSLRCSFLMKKKSMCFFFCNLCELIYRFIYYTCIYTVQCMAISESFHFSLCISLKTNCEVTLSSFFLLLLLII